MRREMILSCARWMEKTGGMASDTCLPLINDVQTIESENQESTKSRPLSVPPVVYRCRSVSWRVCIVWFELDIELGQHIQCAEWIFFAETLLLTNCKGMRCPDSVFDLSSIQISLG
jgi:hypothetical protein